MPAENRIGLIGGSFDPVHNGHIAIAKSFLSSGLLSEIWILLTPNPPHKSEQNFTAFDIRLDMLKACFGDSGRIKISSIEKELSPPQYTYKTIRHLEKKYPDQNFAYCLGEDGYVHFHKWKKYNNILDSCTLVVAARPGYDKSEQSDEKVTEAATFIDHYPVNISSTKIRKLVKKGEDISSLVPHNVEKIIEKENLYKS